MSPLLTWSLRVALLLLVAAIALALFRVFRGPAAQDRVMAFDNMYVSATLAVMVLGLSYESHSYFDAALLMALFGFVGSTALAKFLLRGEVIE